jgi:hypothetical protein
VSRYGRDKSYLEREPIRSRNGFSRKRR